MMYRFMTTSQFPIFGTDWESLADRRKVARMRALYKAYNGESAWKDIADRLQVSRYLSRDDHCWKIRARKQRIDAGKCCK
jgi:hypothetical protein